MKRRNRKNKRSSTFSFEKLEPRQLLAADLGPLNLLVNGDFEQTPEPGAVANFHDSEDVAGFNAANADDGQQIALFTFGTGDDANTVLKLDSVGSQIDEVFQDIATDANETYVVSFDLRGQIQEELIVESVEVFWNGDLVGEFTSSNIWTTHAVTVTGIAGDSRLEFREQGDDGGDGLGVLIDNVNVVESVEAPVTNGSFEIVDGTGPFFGNGSINGWTALDRGGRPDLIQIQANGANLNAPATDGSSVLNLDTTSDQVDHVYTDFATTEGQLYFVTFDVFADGEQVDNPDEVRVRWKTADSEIQTDQWIATLFGNSTWQSYGFLVEGLGDISRLELREPAGSPGDGSGALIDNVRLHLLEGVINDIEVDANGDGTGSGATAVLQQGAASVDIATDLTLAHPSGENLTSATVSITNSPAILEDVLSVVPGDSGITQIFDSTTGTLALSGDASIATWQSVLQTLQYQNNGASPTVGNRSISISVSDDAILGDDQESAAVTIDVNVNSNQLQLAAISAQTVEAGSPLFVSLDIDNPANVGLSFSGVSADSSIVTPLFETGDSLRLNISAPDAQTDGQASPLEGEITFQLIESIYGDAGSRATDRVRTLANAGFYDGIEFHRIIESFVIQGGDPTGTGTGGSDLGNFDDQFSTLLQHNREGLLSYAKSLDDTNDSQFFITDGPTRSLDFQHTIFGVLTSGEDLREAIDGVDTGINPNNPGAGDFPVGSVTISEAEIFQDNSRAALLLVAPEGVTGETTLTVTVEDEFGNQTTQEITVNVVTPTGANVDSNPFLDDIPDLDGSFGVQETFQLTAQDVENDSVRFLDIDEIQAINAALTPAFQIQVPNFNGDDSFSYSVDIDTGLLTFTPGSAADSPDSVQFIVGVAQEPRPGEPINNQNVDLQVVTLNLT